MDFQSIIKNIEWFKNTKDVIGEEATKLYLIYPFLNFLGYDIHSPYEVKFEYECDMHENGSRRVDCAILNDDGKSLIIVEAKAFGKNLDEFVGQIKSYFVSSGAQYAFLTDGNKYLIFDKEQITGDFYLAMPKVQFCLDSLHESDIKLIRGFAKINLKNFITKKEVVVEELIEDEEVDELSVDDDILVKSMQSTNIEIFEKFAIENKDFIAGKSVESVYSRYVEYSDCLNHRPISAGKFENSIKEKLFVKSAYSGGIKYFVRDDTSVVIVQAFINDYGISKLHNAVCDEVYKRYKDYCNDNSLIIVSKNVFCREVVLANNKIIVERKKINGIYVDCFADNDILKENNSGINISVMSKEEKGFLNYCKSVEVSDFLFKTSTDVYLEYQKFCEHNKYPLMPQIIWGKRIKKMFAIKTTLKNIQGTAKRVFVKI